MKNYRLPVFIFVMGAIMVSCVIGNHIDGQRKRFERCVERAGGGDEAYCLCSEAIYDDKCD